VDGGTISGAEDDDVSSVMTDDQRFRLREVIMQDEKIQTFLKETYTTERILQLKDHQSIQQVIEPQKWDVLIRILDNHEVLSGAGTDTNTKSSPQRSSVTGHEVRSMTEAMVDFSYGESSGALVSHSSGGAMVGSRGGLAGPATVVSQRSGASSTMRSAADRSATEMEESDHTFVINREAYFQTSESYHHQQL